MATLQKASAELLDINKIIFQCEEKGSDCSYAFYIYLNDEIIERVPYSPQNRITFWATLPGEYRAAAFIKDAEGKKERYSTNSVEFKVENVIYESDDKRNRRTAWENAAAIMKEMVTHFPMTFRLAVYDYRLENQDTYLGKLWSILTPLIQIGTYWLVFGVGLRQGKDVDGFPYVVWMLCGLIPWFFINQGIVRGANSIYSKVSTLTRMKFPLSTLPLERTLVEVFEHVMMLLIMTIMLCFFGYYPKISWLNLIYYIVYLVAFSTSLALITSVFTMLARDFLKLIQNTIRLLFYITPILWDMGRMPVLFQKVTQFNPIYYVVCGFRESILSGIPFWESPYRIMFFWGLILLLFLAGASLQIRFRSQFVDLL